MLSSYFFAGGTGGGAGLNAGGGDGVTPFSTFRGVAGDDAGLSAIEGSLITRYASAAAAVAAVVCIAAAVSALSRVPRSADPVAGAAVAVLVACDLPSCFS